MKSAKSLYPEIVLGGEYAISYTIGLALIPIITLGVPFAEWLKNSNVPFADWTISSSIGTVCAALLLIIIDNSILRNRTSRPIPNNALFILGFVLGLVKGFVTGVSATKLLNIPGVTFDDNVRRSLTSALIGMITVPTASFCVYSWRHLKQHRSFAKQRLSAIDEFNLFSENQLSAQFIIENTKQHLDKVKLEFMQEAKGSSSFDAIALADLLEKSAREVIRPLSHQVANEKKIYSSFWQVFRDSIILFPIVLSRTIPWVLALFSLLSASILLNRYHLGLGMTILISDLLVISILLYGFKLVISRIEPRIIRIIFLGTVTLLLIDFFHFLIFFWLTGENSFGAFLINLVSLFFMLIISLVANIYSVFEIRKTDSFDRKYMVEFDRVLRRNNSRTELNNEIVRFLHGTLQTRLSASAFRFRNSSTNPLGFDFEVEYQKVLSHFDLDAEISRVITGEVLADKLDEIVSKWESLIKCSVELNVDLSRMYQGQVIRICDFINEALSNALRHGKANSATIQITDAVKDILIVVRNDGQPLAKSSNGLGSKLYDELTTGRWELASNTQGSGVILTGLIPRFL